MQDDELTPPTPLTPLSNDEKSAFAALPREIAPPAGLEDRVTSAVLAADVTDAGPPASTSSPWASGLLRAAAAAILFIAGAAAGRATAPDAASSPAPYSEDDRPPFLLTLYGGMPLAKKPAEELVEEYSAWARQLSDSGHLVAAARLDNERQVLGDWKWVPDDMHAPVGFFYVRASSRAEAQEIASQSPHVRYGGAVELRGVVRR